jgi:hypothetical protein
MITADDVLEQPIHFRMRDSGSLVFVPDVCAPPRVVFSMEEIQASSRSDATRDERLGPEAAKLSNDLIEAGSSGLKVDKLQVGSRLLPHDIKNSADGCSFDSFSHSML